eukprot:GAHX01003440.1.p1 GENE.GAHX01003440.1~~GAHX01003440.1.p1  ORF type:complete len:177 (+),score=12.28 GAHX01003440.1:28-531(+)
MPWTIKFIYGFLVDQHAANPRRKLKILGFLPIIQLFITIVPLITELTQFQYCIFTLLSSFPSALFNTTFYSYFYQGILSGEYEKKILSRTLSCQYTGSLIGNILYLVLGLVFARNLEKTIFSAYLILTAVSLALFVINIILYRNRTSAVLDNENKLENFNTEITKTT